MPSSNISDSPKAVATPSSASLFKRTKTQQPPVTKAEFQATQGDKLMPSARQVKAATKGQMIPGERFGLVKSIGSVLRNNWKAIATTATVVGGGVAAGLLHASWLPQVVHFATSPVGMGVIAGVAAAALVTLAVYVTRNLITTVKHVQASNARKVAANPLAQEAEAGQTPKAIEVKPSTPKATQAKVSTPKASTVSQTPLKSVSILDLPETAFDEAAGSAKLTDRDDRQVAKSPEPALSPRVSMESDTSFSSVKTGATDMSAVLSGRKDPLSDLLKHAVH